MNTQNDLKQAQSEFAILQTAQPAAHTAQQSNAVIFANSPETANKNLIKLYNTCNCTTLVGKKLFKMADEKLQ